MKAQNKTLISALKITKFRIMKKVLLVVGLLGTLAMTSCKKGGCTDVNAQNYSSVANEDNGTCSYKSQKVFWINQETSEWLLELGSYKLLIELDGDLALELLCSEFRTDAPNVETDDVFFQSVVLDLGGDYMTSKNMSITDDLGNQLWSNEIYFQGGKSSTYEISRY